MIYGHSLKRGYGCFLAQSHIYISGVFYNYRRWSYKIRLEQVLYKKAKKLKKIVNIHEKC